MASYHLRMKNDTRIPVAKKYRQNVMPITFYARTENPMRTISIVKEHKATRMIVFSRVVSCQSGLKTRHKDFSTPQRDTRTKGIVATKKSSCLYPMN